MRHAMIIAILSGAALTILAGAGPDKDAGSQPSSQPATQSVKVFYFGNSLTGCSDPKDHEALAKAAGREWKTFAFLGAGWQLWQHLNALQTSGAGMKRDDNGDLTIDPSSVQQSTPMVVKKFMGTRGDKWDAIVLQPFSMALTWKCKEMWGVKFDRETDVGDIASANGIIEIYLKLNPRGQVFIYQDWPAMKPGKIPPQDKLPEWAKQKGVRIADAEFPLRDEFDYEKEWSGCKYKPSSDPEKFWMQENVRSKDYQDQLFAAIREKYPQLYKEGRLRVIPVGDIFLALHRKMKAGEFPGCKSINDYYTDVQHIRGGLPRYTVAAAFYACIFNDRPDKLDWKIYNDASRYGEDKSHDALPVLEITAEQVKIVNDTIWEVILQDPGIKKTKSP